MVAEPSGRRERMSVEDLNPNYQLDLIASAIGKLGRSEFADVFTDITVGSPAGKITVYVTSLARGADILTSIHQHESAIVSNLVVLKKSKYTRVELSAQMDRIMSSRNLANLGISIIGAAPDGSHLVATTPHAKTMSTMHEEVQVQLSGPQQIPVVFVVGSAPRPAA